MREYFTHVLRAV